MTAARAALHTQKSTGDSTRLRSFLEILAELFTTFDLRLRDLLPLAPCSSRLAPPLDKSVRPKATAVVEHAARADASLLENDL